MVYVGWYWGENSGSNIRCCSCKGVSYLAALNARIPFVEGAYERGLQPRFRQHGTPENENCFHKLK